MNQKTILLRDVSSLQTDLQIQCNPMKVTVGSLFFVADSKIHTEVQTAYNSQK